MNYDLNFDCRNFMKVFGIFHKLHGKQFCSQIKKMKKSQLFVLLNIILVRDWFRCSYFNELNIYAYSWCVQNFMKISRLNFEDEHFLPNHYLAKKNIGTVWKFKIIFLSTVQTWTCKEIIGWIRAYWLFYGRQWNFWVICKNFKLDF